MVSVETCSGSPTPAEVEVVFCEQYNFRLEGDYLNGLLANEASRQYAFRRSPILVSLETCTGSPTPAEAIVVFCEQYNFRIEGDYLNGLLAHEASRQYAFSWSPIQESLETCTGSPTCAIFSSSLIGTRRVLFL